MLPLEVVSDQCPQPSACRSDRPQFRARGRARACQPPPSWPAPMPVCATAYGLMLGTPTFRLYGNDDPIGAQLGGAAKNVIAIAAGAVIGAGLGENARAALVTRGLSELRRLAVALGRAGRNRHGAVGAWRPAADLHRPVQPQFQPGLRAWSGREPGRASSPAASAVTEGVATAAALVARAGTLNCRSAERWRNCWPAPRHWIRRSRSFCRVRNGTNRNTDARVNSGTC